MMQVLDGLSTAALNAPTEVLEREIARLRREQEAAHQEVVRTSWGGVTRETYIANVLAKARQEVYGHALRVLQAELDRRKVNGEA